jgi:hypothetical protein
MTLRVAPLVLAAAIAIPRASGAAVAIEAFYGITRPPSASFTASVSGAANDPDLLDSSLQIAGGDVIVRLGLLELGAIADTSWRSDSASQTAIGVLAGFGGDYRRVLRLEALAELGGQRYGNFLENPDIVTSSSTSEWFAYVGLRPGVAYRIAAGRMGVLVGLWAFVRWDLNTSNVPVTVRTATDTAPGSLELGGTTIGAVARVGFDF